ncbi:MAG: hypothetical protein LBH32_09265 [Dysgonamonadaceae bacterium]|jgi:hypothetical protein|nr:hypothetical protein [Dysgonamonadaceae bacterium]
MKQYILIISLILSGFVACTDDIPEREISPVTPENCKGVFFPSSNKASVELEPTEATEFSITIARTDSIGSIEVPIKVDVNDENVFIVPQKVTFADKEKETTFTVSFPQAGVGTTYNLKLSLAGDEYVNQYNVGLPTLATSVTRVKWDVINDKIVMINPFWSGDKHYISKAEIASYGSGDIVNSIRLTNPFATAGGEDAQPDENGIYQGVPEIWPEEILRDDVTAIITVDRQDRAVFKRTTIGFTWYDAESEIVTEDYGEAVRDADGNIVKIVFPAKSLFIIANSAGQGWRSSEDLIVYLSWDVYMADNMKIEDFNKLDYEDIQGAVSEFESKAYSQSWNQGFAKAIDVDSTNTESEYKNLYILPDLYAESYGLAFYYDGKSLTVPANQQTGQKYMGNPIFVSASNRIESSVTTSSKGVSNYTFGLKFHYEDGTVVGEFAETFYYSKDPVAYSISDFYGNFKLTGSSQFTGYPDADMNVTIAAGAQANTFVITGMDLCEEVAATFDPATSTLSIAPQALADYNTYDITLYTTTIEGDVSETAAMDFNFNMSGNLVMTSTSEADGYLLESQAAGGWVDGYYNLKFTPLQSEVAKKAAKAKTVSTHGNPAKVKTATNAKKLSKGNFAVQSKASLKTFNKKSGLVPMF